MKTKLTLVATAAAFLFTLSACNPEDFIKEVIDENDGYMAMTTSNASEGEQYFAAGDTAKFQAVLCDIDSTNSTTRFVGMANKLTERVEGNTYPIFGMNLMGSDETTYDIDFPINDADFLLNLNWSRLLTGDNNVNIMLVAVASDAYYIATNGRVTIDSFGEVAEQVTGVVDNMVCKYITEAKIQYIRDLKERIARGVIDPATYGSDAALAAQELAAIDWGTYFPTIVFDGNFTCLRTNMGRYLNAISDIE